MKRSTSRQSQAGAYKTGPFVLKISSDPAHLAPTRVAIERLCTDGGFNAESAAAIGLAVNEAVANVIRHAYGGAPGKPIELCVRFDNEGVTIELRDWGNGTNPCDLAPPPPNPLKPGGLGLLCMRQMMDSLVFTPQPDGMLLVMKKRKSSASAA
jgi:anti-sigma regulatory factor (Ser/Thr protein kinase)